MAQKTGKQDKIFKSKKKLIKNLFFLAHTLASIIGGTALMHSNWNTLLTQGFKVPESDFLPKGPGPLGHTPVIPCECLRHILQTYTLGNLGL